jgi:O-antigen ligase
MVTVLCVLFSGGANRARVDGLAGANETRIATLSALALAVAALLVALAVAGRLPVAALTRSGWLLLASTVALTAWVGASLAWSIQGDRSWDYANLTLVYGALIVLGVVAGSAAGAPRTVAVVLAAGLGAAMLWGLAGKVVPALDPGGDVTGRMRGTLDYWNAFALLAAACLPLALWLGRLRGALLLYVATIALLLTFSRGGLFAAAVAVGLWLLLAPNRTRTIGTLAAGGLPALAVSAFAFALPGVSSDQQPRDVRIHDGILFAIALAVGAVLVVMLTRRRVGMTPRRWRALLVGVPVVIAAAVAAGVATSSGPLTIHAGPSRFLRVGSSDRWQWWTESVDIFKDRPLAGAGAGTFQLASRRYAGSEAVAAEPHDLPLQFLAELGIVGLALLLAVLVAAIAVVIGAVRRTDDLAVPALAAVCGAYLVHSLLEFDWDFVALTGPVALVVGVLAATGRPALAPRRRLVPALAALLVGAAALSSVATPWAADQRIEDSRTALDDGDPIAAGAAAEDAHDLNPLSAEALVAWALAEEFQGHRTRAADLYRRATDLQPENPRVWRARAKFQFETLHDAALARRSIARALTLDPADADLRAFAEEIG